MRCSIVKFCPRHRCLISWMPRTTKRAASVASHSTNLSCKEWQMHPSLVIINNTIQLLPCFPALLSYYAYNIIICDLVGKKVKASHTRYRTLGLELIAGVQAVSPQVTISHPPGGGCHYLPPGLQLPSQPQSITANWPVPKYTAWWQRHTGVNNLPKVVMQLLPRVGFAYTTCWSQVRRSSHLVT